jgi:hypothetical protein
MDTANIYKGKTCWTTSRPLVTSLAAKASALAVATVVKGMVSMEGVVTT